MADAEDKKKEKEELKAKKKAEEKAAKEAKKETKSEQSDPQAEQAGSGGGGGVLQWIVMAVVIVVFSGSGLILGRLFAGSGPSGDPNAVVQKQPEKQEQPEKQAPEGKTDASADSQEVWHYEKLDPVVANPDVPGSVRYVRVALTLEISSELNKIEGEKFLENKKPVLINWLNIYLKSLTLEDLRGDKNMKRIQSQILDAFNEQLWPDSKPKIKKVLLKEFAIQ